MFTEVFGLDIAINRHISESLHKENTRHRIAQQMLTWC